MSRNPPHGGKKKIVVTLSTGIAILLGSAASFGLGFESSALSTELAMENTLTRTVDEAVSSSLRVTPRTSLAPLRVPTCSVSENLDDPAWGQFSGVVLDPDTGEVLFHRNKDRSLAPASVQKIITGVAAIATLGPETVFSTSTLVTNDPEVLVLKAGGDLTLSVTPESTDSVYAGAAKIDELAAQTMATLESARPEGEKVSIRTLIVDVSLWDGEDNWRTAWASSARTNGYISRITPLQIDGDRFSPMSPMGQRSNEPIERATRAFIAALRQAGNSAGFVTVTYEATPAGAVSVASVSSRPVSELVHYMLKESDNTLAEMLGRQVSLSLGLGGSGDSVGEALLRPLDYLELNKTLVTMDDASGLSSANQVTPQFVASLLQQVYQSSSALSDVMSGLPIAGVDGSLDDRFTGDNAVVRSKVAAKTGSIQGTRSLAGLVTTEEGDDLVFAFFATGNVDDGARQLLEDLVVEVYRCGSNLADF